MTEKKCPKVIVLGIGNILLSDEGIGIHAINELKREKWPEEVELVDGGTGGLGLLSVLEGAQKVIIIDSLETGVEPGTIFRFEPKDLKAFMDRSALSLHQVGILEGPNIGRSLNHLPPVVVFGVQPKSLAMGIDLTPEVKAKLPKVVKMVGDEICQALCIERSSEEG